MFALLLVLTSQVVLTSTVVHLSDGAALAHGVAQQLERGEMDIDEDQFFFSGQAGGVVARLDDFFAIRLAPELGYFRSKGLALSFRYDGKPGEPVRRQTWAEAGGFGRGARSSVLRSEPLRPCAAGSCASAVGSSEGHVPAIHVCVLVVMLYGRAIRDALWLRDSAFERSLLSSAERLPNT